MEILQWASDHGFNLLEAVGIIASLGFTAAAFRRDDKSRQIGNLLALTTSHREIWRELYKRPELGQVLDGGRDLTSTPATDQEELFLTFLILHLSVAFHATKDGVFLAPEALAEDIRSFFSLPVPRSLWERLKPLQDQDFVRFVDECLQS